MHKQEQAAIKVTTFYTLQFVCNDISCIDQLLYKFMMISINGQ